MGFAIDVTGVGTIENPSALLIGSLGFGSLAIYHPAIMSNSKNDIAMLISLCLLVFLIQFLFLSSSMGIVLNCGIFLTNAFFLFNGIFYVRKQSDLKFSLYFAGYFVLFVIFFAIIDFPSIQPMRGLLFILFLLLYTGSFHVPILLGYLFIFLFSYVFLTVYAFTTFALLSVVYTGLFFILKARTSFFLPSAYVVGCTLLIVTLFPVVYFCSQTSPQDVIGSFMDTTGQGGVAATEAREVREALAISLVSATITTLVVLILGVPLAYSMVRANFRGKELMDSLIDIPILIPQPAAGIALLVLLGPGTLLGKALDEHLGIRVAGSLWGIVAAQVFVSCPFLIRTSMAAFQGIDERLERVARSLGAPHSSVFFRIVLPMAAKGIFSGCTLTWCRAISEFGTLRFIAYRPATASVLVYDKFTQFGRDEARPIAVLLIIVCLWIFICLRFIRSYPLIRWQHSESSL